MAIADAEDPLWYKDAVIYELHVRAFGDSDGDGVGDFVGLTERLDYLQQLGVTAIWLLPFYPSPLRDDGYDIADYGNVNPAYGTRRDFKAFLREAHRRGLRVITELVLNHTSDQHPWFQRARTRQAGEPLARLLRVERHLRPLHRGPGHLRGLRDLELDVGPGGRGVLLAPLLLPPARPQLRQPRGAGHHAARRRRVAGDGRRRGASRRRALPVRAGGHQLREPARDPRLPARAAGPRRRPTSPAACCWPRPTSGPRTRSPTSATATSATPPSTSRSCPGCSCRCAWRTASRSSTSSSRPPTSPPRPSGPSSCATTTS